LTAAVSDASGAARPLPIAGALERLRTLHNEG
jgi:hypothetical protein